MMPVIVCREIGTFFTITESFLAFRIVFTWVEEQNQSGFVAGRLGIGFGFAAAHEPAYACGKCEDDKVRQVLETHGQ